MNPTLLPAGCYDVLPPRARLETQLSYHLLNVFEAFGYLQVTPPMLEYTDSLLAGRGATLSPQMIRVIDPQTQKVMGFRPDMTLQIGRIAASRLADEPRPLRLCYAGPILRMQSSESHINRQMRQAGIEMIGADGATSDAEVILVALKSLQALGISELTLDINLPVLIGSILAECSLENHEIEEVFTALAHKDATALRAFKEPACDVLCELMLLSNTPDSMLQSLAAMDLPADIQPHLATLKQVVEYLKPHLNDYVQLSIDVTERGGFDYYSGISFSIYATSHGRELGRGGRYIIHYGNANESAMGCTFYTDSLRDLMPKPADAEKVYVTEGLACRDIAKLHDQGYHTIFALNTNPAIDEAKRLGCTYIYQQEKLIKL